MLRAFFAVLGVGLIISLGCLLEAQSQTVSPPSVEPSITHQIFAPGRVEGATQEIELRPQLRGQIMRVPVREGDVVKEGDILLQLDAQQYEHEVTLAKAELALALAERDRLKNGARQQERDEATALHNAKQAELQLAKLVSNRTQKLRKESVVSQQEADDHEGKVQALEAEVAATKARAELLAAAAREDELAISEAKISAAKSRLELAEVTLSRASLKAHSACQVLQINAEAGELAGPETTEPTLIVSDTSRFRVRAFVEELDAPRVQIGMSARIMADGLPDQEIHGEVVQLSPRMSAKRIWNDDPAERYDTKTREVWIDVAACPALVVGLRVDVVISPTPAP